MTSPFGGIDVAKYPLAAGDYRRRRMYLGLTTDTAGDLDQIKADPAKRQREIEIALERQAIADDTWGRGKLWGANP